MRQRDWVVVTLALVSCDSGVPRVTPDGSVDAAGVSSDAGGGSPYTTWAGGGLRTSLLGFDGNTWRAFMWTSQNNDCFINSIWGSGASDVWVTGYQCDNSQPMYAQWDGAHWTTTLLPKQMIQYPERTWGVGGGDFWIAGVVTNTGPAVLVHVRPNATDFVSIPNAPMSTSLEGIWGSGSDDVWTVGSIGMRPSIMGVASHWDGSAWSPVAQVGASKVIWAISGTGPDDYWAAGSDGTAGLVVHGTRTGWSTPISIPNTYDIRGIFAISPTNVWAVGNDSSSGIVAHWDGNSWSGPVLVDQAFMLEDVHGDANNVWASGCGFDRFGAPEGIVIHWTGGWGSTPEYFERPEADGLVTIWSAN